MFLRRTIPIFTSDHTELFPGHLLLANGYKIKEDGIYGAPDAVIEVLSPGNQNLDLIKKKAVYEEFGVKEYFIVDPDDKSVRTYYLKNNKFDEQRAHKGKLVSKLLNAELTF